MIQYRIKPVTRYIVTRYESVGVAGEGGNQPVAQSTQRGEFDNAATAYAVGYALCKAEHDKSGEDAGSMNFIYPDQPEQVA